MVRRIPSTKPSRIVSVLTILLGFVDGMRRTMTLAGERDHWVILQRGVLVETGYISHESYDIFKTMPEIATDAAGNPLLSPEDISGFDPTPERTTRVERNAAVGPADCL